MKTAALLLGIIALAAALFYFTKLQRGSLPAE